MFVLVKRAFITALGSAILAAGGAATCPAPGTNSGTGTEVVVASGGHGWIGEDGP